MSIGELRELRKKISIRISVIGSESPLRISLTELRKKISIRISVIGSESPLRISLTIFTTSKVEGDRLQVVGERVEDTASLIRSGMHAVGASNTPEVGSRGKRSEEKKTKRELESHRSCLVTD